MTNPTTPPAGQPDENEDRADTSTTNPRPGDLRVWYIPQVPMDTPYIRPVPDLATARLVADVLATFSLYEYENRVKPDYADAVGIERYESDGAGGYEWADVDDEEIAAA